MPNPNPVFFVFVLDSWVISKIVNPNSSEEVQIMEIVYLSKFFLWRLFVM
jgi:hypothetical protein